jgi:hypothetical protein
VNSEAFSETDDFFLSSKLLPPSKILQHQTSSTELRGGQAGGFSSLEYQSNNIISTFSNHNAMDEDYSTPTPVRVRCVAKKRSPLAADLTRLYLKAGGRDNLSNSITTGKKREPE